jgi:hypothetical protein
MNKRILVAVPVMVAVAYLALQAFFPSGPARAYFYTAEIATVKLLATVGCLAAAVRYRRGEYVGIAWWLIGIDYFLLFSKDLLFGRIVHLPGIEGDTAALYRAIFVVAGNLGAAIGCIMLARTWAVAGIELPGSRTSQRIALGIAIAAAVAVVGLGVWNDAHHIHTDSEAVVGIASSLGDLVCFSVIAPLLLTALAMRGGALFWPWALITGSNMAWLFYDVSWGFQRQLNVNEATLKTVAELWRGLGCSLAFVAGLAQRWAMRSTPRMPH